MKPLYNSGNNKQQVRYWKIWWTFQVFWTEEKLFSEPKSEYMTQGPLKIRLEDCALQIQTDHKYLNAVITQRRISKEMQISTLFICTQNDWQSVYLNESKAESKVFVLYMWFYV